MGYKHTLLVEGWDDQYVLRNLLKANHISSVIAQRDFVKPENIAIIGKEGINSLLNSLAVIVNDEDLERLGIVVDADVNLDARWSSLRNILLRFGTANLPPRPTPTGTIFTLEQPLRQITIGIWLMPDNSLPGMLEDFVSFLVPDGDTLWQRAIRCVVEIPEAERRFPAAQQRKAELHTWLAWQKEPGTPLGLAVTAGYFKANAPHAQQFVNWVQRLFELS
jgi:hypothetical protein